MIYLVYAWSILCLITGTLLEQPTVLVFGFVGMISVILYTILGNTDD